MTSYPTPKRILDKVVVLLLSVVLAPVVAVVVTAMGISMLVRPRDRGSLLYREPRISRGREFDLLKFRTLRIDVLDQAGSGESHVRLHEADESNLTWAGKRVLKPWYLDELPQLWNVLRGDMSLVGPRPWPPSMVATQVARGYPYRNEFIAGWTGPAQVEKGLVETSGYAELDVAYIEACRASSSWRTVRRDLALLRRTVAVIARGEGLNY